MPFVRIRVAKHPQTNTVDNRVTPSPVTEAGCSASEIQSISDHKTLSEVQRYVAAANQKLLAKAAVKRLGNKFGEPAASTLISLACENVMAHRGRFELPTP